MDTKPTCCIVENGEPCTNPVAFKNRGWCAKHNGRWVRHGDPLKVRGPSPDEQCSIVEDGQQCPKIAKAKAMCGTHYARWRKHGDATIVRSKADRPKKQCSVVEHGVQCEKNAKSRGLCKTHYTRWKRHGDPTETKWKAKEFVQEVLRMEPTDECILWPFAKYPSGYGMIGAGPNSNPRPAHNHILRLVAGDPEPGQEACHAPHDVCGSRACCNPRHLRWDSRKNNQLDRVADQTDFKGERHPHAKITEADVLAIRADTRTYREIGETYGLHKVYVGKIKRCEAWSHV